MWLFYADYSFIEFTENVLLWCVSLSASELTCIKILDLGQIETHPFAIAANEKVFPFNLTMDEN